MTVVASYFASSGIQSKIKRRRPSDGTRQQHQKENLMMTQGKNLRIRILGEGTSPAREEQE